jgi:tetratricopeptide (TPR) repeat protein
MEKGCTYENIRAEFDALKENKDDWSYQKEYLEGMRAFRRGDSVTAIELFKKAYEVNPKIRGLKSNIALLYGKEENHVESQKYLLEAVVENSFDIVALYNLGNAYSRAGDYKQALPYYARVQELVPDFNLARYNLARSYLNTGEEWKAREEFEAFITYAEEHGIYEKEIERSRQAMGQIENTLMQGLLPSMSTPDKTVAP